MKTEPHIPFPSHHLIEADGVNIFYREAGPADAPVVLLLHGLPSSSFQYRDLIPRLADSYHVIAPDFTGHFALETHLEEITAAMREFLAKHLK